MLNKDGTKTFLVSCCLDKKKSVDPDVDAGNLTASGRCLFHTVSPARCLVRVSNSIQYRTGEFFPCGASTWPALNVARRAYVVVIIVVIIVVIRRRYCCNLRRIICDRQCLD